jgi:hypothetical protein
MDERLRGPNTPRTYPRDNTGCNPVELCAKQSILESKRKEGKNAADSQNQTYSSADIDSYQQQFH